MKIKLLILFGLLGLLLIMNACKDDDDGNNGTDYDYHAHILSPNIADKHINDTIHIHVEFESHTSETVHHVNVRIYNKSDSTELYSKPDVAHIHETDGVYEFNDDLVLSVANGVNPHTDWVMVARVWGHENMEGLVSETLEFHVHP